MLAALCMALVAAPFLEQTIPGLHIGTPHRITGTLPTNFLCADMNDDGAIDLLLPEGIYRQENGAFPESGRFPLPVMAGGALCDVYDATLFAITDSGAQRWRFREDQWHATLAPLLLTAEERTGVPTKDGHALAILFTPFLSDIDGDGVPEVIRVTEKAVVVLHLSGDEIRRAHYPNALPDLAVAPLESHPLWPLLKREVKLPRRQASARLTVEDGHLRLLEQRASHESETAYHQRLIAITANDSQERIAPEVTYTVPTGFRPYRLNGDDIPDFAMTSQTFSQASSFPAPLFEVAVTLDGGKTIQRRRARGFAPRSAFIDIDGDGDRDLITESALLFTGDLREVLYRQFATYEVEHQLSVFLQDAHGIYSKGPDRERRFSLRLAEPPIHQTPLMEQYRAGQIFDLSGDLNGDGYKDVVVQDDPQRLTVYLSTANELGVRQAASVPMSVSVQFRIIDLNGDGRDDIVLLASDADSPAKIYLTTGEL